MKKIYPNDLCPCGSGKKYKHCCKSIDNISLFNNHNIPYNPMITNQLHFYMSEYPKSISDREEITAYIKIFQDEKGNTQYKLFDKETDKEIIFWIYPKDINAHKYEKELLKFFEEVKNKNIEELYDKNGEVFITLQGIFGEETGSTIEVFIYTVELFYSTQNSMWI